MKVSFIGLIKTLFKITGNTRELMTMKMTMTKYFIQPL